ncbi:MAG TPA: hypothetical protein VFO67_09220, partial [Gemmatimonadales bacterium]|nr:hypothetical protein [Gemmatimonadales bacterium]
GTAGGLLVSVSLPQNGEPRNFVVQSGMELQVARLLLPPAQRLKAMAGVERFKARLRPGNEERAALMEAMKGILSDEERDNLRAALERRPLVKSRAPLAFKDVVTVGGVVDLRREMIAAPAPQEPEVRR